MTLSAKQFKSENWTLFLDRDGVINRHLPNQYIRSWNQWEYSVNALDAIVDLNRIFNRTLVVTNQQGVSKQLMSIDDLEEIHANFLKDLKARQGNIDRIYYCTELKTDIPNCRKPSPAMALWAKRDFPEIEFEKSIMVGDNITDMQFGRQLDMMTVFISQGESQWEEAKNWADMQHDSLWSFSQAIK